MTEEQENKATLYALGALAKKERAQFEEEMRHDEELSSYVRELCEIATDTAVQELDSGVKPPSTLKSRVMEKIREIPTEILRAFELKEGEGFVLTNNSGEIQWVNSDFSEMCGYALEEIRGKKPGTFLQGPATDPASVDVMRRAIREHRPCHVELANYHKDGTPYWVSISVSPVLDEDRKPRCYVAIEREIRDRDIPEMVS